MDVFILFIMDFIGLVFFLLVVVLVLQISDPFPLENRRALGMVPAFRDERMLFMFVFWFYGDFNLIIELLIQVVRLPFEKPPPHRPVT